MLDIVFGVFVQNEIYLCFKININRPIFAVAGGGAAIIHHSTEYECTFAHKNLRPFEVKTRANSLWLEVIKICRFHFCYSGFYRDIKWISQNAHYVLAAADDGLMAVSVDEQASETSEPLS